MSIFTRFFFGSLVIALVFASDVALSHSSTVNPQSSKHSQYDSTSVQSDISRLAGNLEVLKASICTTNQLRTHFWGPNEFFVSKESGENFHITLDTVLRDVPEISKQVKTIELDLGPNYIGSAIESVSNQQYYAENENYSYTSIAQTPYLYSRVDQLGQRFRAMKLHVCTENQLNGGHMTSPKFQVPENIGNDFQSDVENIILLLSEMAIAAQTLEDKLWLQTILTNDQNTDGLDSQMRSSASAQTLQSRIESLSKNFIALKSFIQIRETSISVPSASGLSPRILREVLDSSVRELSQVSKIVDTFVEETQRASDVRKILQEELNLMRQNFDAQTKLLVSEQSRSRDLEQSVLFLSEEQSKIDDLLRETLKEREQEVLQLSQDNEELKKGNCHVAKTIAEAKRLGGKVAQMKYGCGASNFGTGSSSDSTSSGSSTDSDDESLSRRLFDSHADPEEDGHLVKVVRSLSRLSTMSKEGELSDAKQKLFETQKSLDKKNEDEELRLKQAKEHAENKERLRRELSEHQAKLAEREDEIQKIIGMNANIVQDRNLFSKLASEKNLKHIEINQRKQTLLHSKVTDSDEELGSTGQSSH